MKTRTLTLAVLSAGAMLFIPLKPAVGYGGGRIKAEIKKEAQDLLDVEKQSQKDSLEMAKGREKLEKDVLSQVDRAAARSLVAKNAALNRDYRDDALTDISFLRDHWKDLTLQQRDLVNQGRYEMR